MLMNKLRILFIFSLLIAATVFSSQKKDTILTALEKMNEKEQINKLKDLCWDNRSINPNLAIQYGKMALEKIDESVNDRSKSEVLNFLGVIYGNLGNLDSAYYYYQYAMDVAAELMDSTQIAYSLNNLGDYYYKSALYSAALEKIFEAYGIFETIGDRRGMAYTLNDIGEIYLVQKDYEKALDNFLRSGDIRKSRDDERGYAKSLINLGRVYFAEKKYDTALKTFEDAEPYCRNSGYIKGLSWIQAGVGDIYFELGEYDLALKNKYRALDIDNQIGNKYGQIINYNKLGYLYLKLSDLQKAEEYLNKAKMESRLTGHLDQLMISYNHLKDLYYLKKNYKKAFLFMEDFSSLRDSIYSQENQNKIADLQTAFFNERKIRENELLKKDIEIQKSTRNFFVALFFLITLAIIFLISKYKSAQKHNQLLNELNESKDKLFSIIAHDLKSPFSALSSISQFLQTEYDNLDENDKRELIYSIASSSEDIQKLLNDLLNWARSQRGVIQIRKSPLDINDLLVSLSDTYKFFAKNKDISIKVQSRDGMTVKADKFIIETIIGNLLNNAVKFSHRHGEVILSAKQENNRTIISVQDHGTGMPKKLVDEINTSEKVLITKGTGNEEGTGLGLALCKDFSRLHDAELQIESEPGKGSLFTLVIPEN